MLMSDSLLHLAGAAGVRVAAFAPGVAVAMAMAVHGTLGRTAKMAIEPADELPA